MLDKLDSNTIALVSLIVTIASLVLALIIHNSSLNRNELSKIRDSVINRLENLSELDSLRDKKRHISERDFIFNMHLKVIELDISKYIALAKNIEDVDLYEPLEALMVFDINNLPTETSIFRKRCYTLLSRIDKAYFYEIQSLSLKNKITFYYREILGFFYSILSLYLLSEVLNFIN